MKSIGLREYSKEIKSRNKKAVAPGGKTMSCNHRVFSILSIPIIVAVTCIGCALYAPNAAAQEQEQRRAGLLLEEITVTARKREESSQEVPLAISAYNSAQIDALMEGKESPPPEDWTDDSTPPKSPTDTGKSAADKKADGSIGGPAGQH